MSRKLVATAKASQTNAAKPGAFLSVGPFDWKFRCEAQFHFSKGDQSLKIEKPDAPKSAEIIFFPPKRIVRTILKGNRVYNPPGPRYVE